MIQRFIELGEGYGDFYELLELATSNKNRIYRFIQIETTINKQKRVSLAVVLHPAAQGGFMPIYFCREGISIKSGQSSKRITQFSELATQLQQDIRQLEVRPSVDFPDPELYKQYLIGILRVNHCLPPLNW
ncbi:DUF7147 family protein [Alkalicoccobacillus murimartini]|uniref:DUF7147 domain-containing protein n=1 Tax=Alkalicoccobacillus murimartini TaxID=171685 RepID=A0ABT9YF41_9BACI|nr:methylthioribose kinase [Alkalicoccobacillus murimartini]MDQ0206466.1 hypothetical protein [Alkalicoccobacillus murimartini]